MCGRFVNITKINKLKKIFDIKDSSNTLEEIISYNIAPSANVNVILKNENVTIESITWGIQFIDKINNQINTVINSRLETVKEKILFKESFLKRRCIIPANGYYEWHYNNGNKIPYFIQVPTLETFYFAGLWKYSNNTKSVRKTFSILTKNANNLIKSVHHRMPVILNTDDGLNYIDQGYNILESNFLSNVEKDLDFYTVSKIVNSPSNNSIECILPVNKFGK